MKNIVILLILLVGCRNAPTAVDKKPNLECQVCDGFGFVEYTEDSLIVKMYGTKPGKYKCYLCLGSEIYDPSKEYVVPTMPKFDFEKKAHSNGLGRSCQPY